jgi:aminoglycoside phosphotransferase
MSNLEVERDTWKANCAEAIRQLAEEEQRARALAAALKDLHAMVWGECPSLLNEDSGGDAELDTRIRQLLGEGT